MKSTFLETLRTASGGDVLINWNGGYEPGECWCLPVPVESTTWGKVKSFYR